MEGSAHREGKGAFCASLLAGLARGKHGFFLARDYDLPVAVVVGGDDDSFDAVADFLYLFSGKADDGGHGAGHFLAALLHLVRTHRNQLEGILETHGSCSHEGGELAERVATHHIGGFEPGSAEGESYGVYEDSRLGDLRRAEVFVGAIEHYICNPETQDIIRLVHQGFGLRTAFVKILSHSGELGPLSGEYVCFHSI